MKLLGDKIQRIIRSKIFYYSYALKTKFTNNLRINYINYSKVNIFLKNLAHRQTIAL